MRSLFIVLTLVCITSAYYQQCSPGTYFMKGCNTCVCSNEGRPVCTRNVCHSGFYNPGSSSQNLEQNLLDYIPQIIPGVNQVEVIPSQQIGESHSAAYQVCTPNAAFSINCKRCWCSVFGDSYSCTQSTCGPTQPNQNLPNYPQYPQQNVPTYPQYPQQNITGYPQYPQQNVPGYPQYPQQHIPNYPSTNVPNKHPQTLPTSPVPNVPNKHPDQEVPNDHHKHSHGCGHYRKRV